MHDSLHDGSSMHNGCMHNASMDGSIHNVIMHDGSGCMQNGSMHVGL